ncbi:uncharacterized protein Dwil_GK27489 [Drosophila willistoni]|uniref:Uncharacterized protein n=1 Tax=Drosophila willistoni TaxID=7260 RepID=A0A0Q9WVM1_DROWI|nr:uncharacterized protein Dwil_GK27489 [Drosophila willistoni]
MPKSKSHYEVQPVAVNVMRRKLSTPQITTAPPIPLHRNNNNTKNNNNNNSYNTETPLNNSNNNTLRRKLDITAPRLHATTNPLALTEGAQYIQSDPARCAPKP